MGGSYFPKQETLAFVSGEYGIPEFRMGDFHSTAGLKDSAEQRDEVEPKRDLLPPTIFRMESGMPDYARFSDVCGTGRTHTVRSARS